MLSRYFFILLIFIPFIPFIHKVKAITLENYCIDGYYKINNEKVCSRAPKCAGKDYDEVASLPQPNPQECMGDKDGQRGGCKGYVPLCCYEVERTGDPTMCVGYWERLWCHPQQCDKIDPEKGRVCNDGKPGQCLCGHAFKSWCKGKDAPQPPIPLEVRLGIERLAITPTEIVSPSPNPTNTVSPSPKATPTLAPTKRIYPSPTLTLIYPSPIKKMISLSPTLIIYTPYYKRPTYTPLIQKKEKLSLQRLFKSLVTYKEIFEYKFVDKIKMSVSSFAENTNVKLNQGKIVIINFYWDIKKLDKNLEIFVERLIANIFKK